MENYKSEQLNELGAALAKAQADILVAGTSSDNPFFKSKYADFATIVRVSRPALTKNGLSVMQIVVLQDDGGHVLYSTLLHSSGQFVQSTAKIAPVKQDIQSLGSYITYLKRYTYAALVGVTSSTEDDDGEAATVRDYKNHPSPTKFVSKEHVEPISVDQLSELEYILKDQAAIAQQVLEGLNIVTLGDMPRSKFRAAMDRIREIIALKQ